MRETLLGLAYPLILCASGVFAAGSCWWRRRQRRRGVLPSDVHPAFYAHGPRRPGVVLAQMEAQMRVVKEAHLIVFAEYDRVAALYEEPSRSAPSN